MKSKSKALALPSAFLGSALLIGAVFIWTAPQTKPEEKTRQPKIVQTISVSPQTERISVTVHGSVIPARRVVMKPQVGGRVIRHHPALVPGGFVQAGEELIEIDPADYRLALIEQQTALEEAKFELEVEQGRQVVASREWDLLESDLTESEANRDLVLRQPHLRRTEAMIRKATNEIAKAKLNLARTSVKAPFNAKVLDESIEIGQLMEPGTTICTLVGTDEYWVQATLPLGQLKWIQLPGPDQTGANARVYLDTGSGQAAAWDGTVVQLLSDLEPVGRMARVLVRVPDPLGLNPHAQNDTMPLLIGSYVRVEINAGELNDVLAIPRGAVREGNRIWVVNPENELQIYDVEMLWKRQETVLIANCMQPNEQLVVSDLKAALPGTKVNPQPLETL